MDDVVVVGGGVIGLSIARELAGRGVSVAVLDQAALGREASWAGAGILPPGNPQQASAPEALLRAESHVRWAGLSEDLRIETGIDNGHCRCGGIEVRLSGPADALQPDEQCWTGEGVVVESLSVERARHLEPELSDEVTAAYRLPELGQVRNPRHLKAMLASCAARGVRLLPGVPVRGFDRDNEKIVGVQTDAGTLQAGQFVVTAGAWSSHLLERVGCAVRLDPVRGQIVLLQTNPLPVKHVIQVGPRYLVPRPDGRVLIGSTEEHVGFDKRSTAGGVAGLIQFATSVVPALADASVERTWAGLRPCSADGLPYLGEVPGTENAFVAAGHFRAGLQLSPGTAVAMSQLLLGEQPCVPLEQFSCSRAAATERSVEV